MRLSPKGGMPKSLTQLHVPVYGVQLEAEQDPDPNSGLTGSLYSTNEALPQTDEA